MSDLLKVARAVDGCDLFNIRIEMAAELANVQATRKLKIDVAMEVVDDIVVDEFGTVTTTRVSDEDIIAAVEDKGEPIIGPVDHSHTDGPPEDM